MSRRVGAQFNAAGGDYRRKVERSIAFSRTELDFFTRAKSDALLDEAARRVGDPRELSFLDFGCGPGETDRFLEGRVGGLAGVDVASELVEAAGERNPWVEYTTVEAFEPLPHATAAFDVCFAICVLHHVPPRRRLEVVREMARVTRSGGMTAIFEHNPWNPLTRYAIARCEFDEDATLLRRGEVERLLRDAGLVDAEARYILFFTRESARLRGIERRLGGVPLGAQYAVTARAP